MTTTTRPDKRTTRTAIGLLVAALAAVALLAAGAGTAAAAPQQTVRVSSTCWKDVVNDWLQHQPNVVGTYPITCYRQAIQHLNKYPDIQQYSNAPDDIHRAMLLAIRNGKNGSGGGQGGSTPGGGGGGTSSGGGKGSSPSGSGSTPSTHKSVVTRLFDAVGPGNAQSIPLPLLVLAGLAILLLLAAIGTWLAKRIQARRMTPAPAPVQRR